MCSKLWDCMAQWVCKIVVLHLWNAEKVINNSYLIKKFYLDIEEANKLQWKVCECEWVRAGFHFLMTRFLIFQISINVQNKSLQRAFAFKELSKTMFCLKDSLKRRTFPQIYNQITPQATIGFSFPITERHSHWLHTLAVHYYILKSIFKREKCNKNQK